MSTQALPVDDRLLAQLNPEQRRAAAHGDEPLLVIAGAGTGKTTTLAHRVAHLVARGVDPGRILLLTFARRASAELLRRVESILRKAGSTVDVTGRSRIWGGTFHAVATRLLRLHGEAIGLGPDFVVVDRADSEDLLDVVRHDLGLSSPEKLGGKRFPKKGTCLEIYSRAVSSRAPLADVLAAGWPWCRDFEAELKKLFLGYVDRKAEQSVLDYDDLLLYWHGLLADRVAGEDVRRRFDCVLVDEYQDTNLLQSEILRLLRPDGRGLTVVGDDAQSIYSFRAATVRNILDFPSQYAGTQVIPLEQNYRSTPPILDATNAIIAHAAERHEKRLWSKRAPGDKPRLVTCRDEEEQTGYVIGRILEHREQGLQLRQQAVLFRTSHHSLGLELELGRRQIPFHKYGGLKFVEAAHVKDVTAFLRLAENPRDLVATTRVLMLFAGVGPKRARQLADAVVAPKDPFASWRHLPSPPPKWDAFLSLLTDLASPRPPDLPSQLHRVRELWGALVEDRYDNLPARLRDLEQLEQIAARHPDRRTFLADLVLDPPASTQELAGPPLLDEDYLILSTIHSAKGLEWPAVFVIHAADGNIPSDMATGHPEEIEEERRLFYVATTRAKDHLDVTFPLRYYTRPTGTSDRHTYAQLSRFLAPDVRVHFDERTLTPAAAPVEPAVARAAGEDIRNRLRAMWS